jgi:hypothetical protein
MSKEFSLKEAVEKLKDFREIQLKRSLESVENLVQVMQKATKKPKKINWNRK